MPLEEVPNNPALENSLAQSDAGIEAPVKEAGPLYRVVGDAKIPVSKQLGMLWASRKDQGLSARGDSETRWDEAIRYYCNDQTAYRRSRDNSSGNTNNAQRLNKEYTETENVVFSNCAIMVPMLYAKNPTITMSTENDANTDWARCVERLGNVLLSMKTAPGLNFKHKMRRTVLTTLLTNNAIIKIGWVNKQDSSEEAINELEKLSLKLQNAKTKQEIKNAEGELTALEEKIDLLSPAGPITRALMPHRVVVDPTSTEPDGSDANWMMEWEYLPTAYINAVYGKPSGDKFTSVYEPTHIMSAGDNTQSGVEDEVNSFQLIKDKSDLKPNAYGYSTQSQLDAASRTKVWYVWDRTTRRVYMYADNYWKWPIWVWDDPLKLPRFFPYFRLWFHESPNDNAPTGEVTYYLDQQDAINEINDEVRRGRAWAKRNIFYNKNVLSKEDAEAVLKGPDGTARGVKLGEGMKLSDAVMSMTPPALKFPELFNTDSKFGAINRITGINDAMRGAQFRTNTTNKAVDAYQQNVDIRVDERTDLIEDFIADIMWNILMLCMMKWDTADVQSLVGPEMAPNWKRINDPRQFDTAFNARVEGGSIAKPNSKEKKAQAIQLGQVLGQFANAAPAVIIVVMKMFEKAFDEVVLTDQDWQLVEDTMKAALMKAGGGPGGQQQPSQQQEPPDPNADPAQNDEQLKAQLIEKIKALPPAAQQHLQQLVKQGVPPAEALKQVEQQVQSATS